MSITILIIDDEPRVLQAFVRKVRLAGYRVLTADGGEAGLALYHQEQPEIVMTDLRMPDMTGLHVLQAIRQHDAEANVILTSGHGDREAILEAMRAGASDFLPKPVDQVVLESALRRAAERVHLKRELRASQEALRQQNAELEATVRARTVELERELEERKHIEAALRDSESRFRSLFENSPIAYQSLNEAGQYIDVNHRLCELLGYSRDELIGKTFGELWSDRIRQRFPQAFEGFKCSGAVVKELDLVHKDGSPLTVVLEGRTQHDLDSNFVRTHCILHNITERKQMESALQESEALLSAVGQMVKVGGWELDAETRALWWTEQTYHIHGVPLDYQPQLEKALNFFHPEDRQRLTQVVQRALEEGTPYDEELRFINAHGEQLWVRTICQPQVVEGKTRKLKGTFRDITARKRAETALQYADDIVRNISVGLYIYHLEDLADDRTLRMVEVNPAAERITGLPSANLLGRTLDENFPGLRALDLPQRYAEVVRTQTAQEFKDFIYGDERLAPAVYMVKAFPLPNHHVGIAFDDFTARHQAEDALRARTAMLANAEKLAHVGSWAWDIPTNRFTLSEGWQEIHGCYTGELSQVDLMPIAHPDDFLKVERAFAQALQGGVPYNIEHRIIRQDNGEVRYIHSYGEVVYDDYGDPIKVYGAALDITERKQAEETLHASERNLLEAQTIARLGRWELDMSADHLDWSHTIYEIFELDPEQFQPSYEDFLAVIHPEDRESVNQAYLNSLDDRQPYDIEHRLLLPSGRIKWLHEICRTYYDDQGQPLRSVGVVQDITRRKEMDLQLQAYADLLQEYAERLEELVDEKVQELEAAHAQVVQLDKLASLGQLATGIAHELKQPLTAITFEADYLTTLARKLRETATPDALALLNVNELERTGHDLRDDVNRCLIIIDHLRDFGRVASENTAPVDLNQPIRDSHRLVGAQLREHNVTVELRLTEDLSRIQANPHKLEQVFLNLIGNAEYAMQAAAEQDGREKTLTLSTRQEGDWVVAEVRDTGCGMSEEAQKRLFEPFFTTKPEGDGTGLGLSICYGIVTGFGGDIACESAPGAGTAFILRFPVHEE